MKKQLVKNLAIFLTVLTLVSFMGIQSFALSLIPSPKSAEILNADSAEPISLKALGEYFAEREDDAKHLHKHDSKHDMTFEEYTDYVSPLSLTYYSPYATFSSLFAYYCSNYNYKIKLTNCKTYEFKDGVSDSGNSIYSIDTATYITRNSFEEALERKDGTIDLTVAALTYSNADGLGQIGDIKTFKLKVPAVEKIVDSIEIVSGVPDVFPYYATHYDNIVGATFLIKYYDGTQKTAKVVQELYETPAPLLYYCAKYYLDGKQLTIYEDYEYVEGPDGEEIRDAFVYFEYCDAVLEKEITYTKETPFEKIEIDDYEVINHNDKIYLDRISYSVYYKNGTSEAFETDVYLRSYSSLVINALNGYIVTVWLGDNEDDEKGAISLRLGDLQDWEEFDPPTEEPFEEPEKACECNCHASSFKGFIGKIQVFLWKLFKVNAFCECGKLHYW